MWYKAVAKPLFFRLDPEHAHRLAFATGRLIGDVDWLRSLVAQRYGRPDPILASEHYGLRYPSPIGTAAGFDKNAELVRVLPALGFGHMEVGSVTALPSSGNPRPRLFRLPEDQALINRMGLNNRGCDAISARLIGFRSDVPVSVNVAKTHDSRILGADAVRDYARSVEVMESVADLIVLNVSCPNTEEGKTFEDPVAFSELVQAVRSRKPVLVKFSPDVDERTLERLTAIALDAGITGFVAVNTSTRRDGLATSAQRLATIGKGGLSGRPLRDRAVDTVRILKRMVPAESTVISVGGISDIQDVVGRLRAGAHLVQMYTGLVYEGPLLAHRLNRQLAELIRQDGASSLAEWLTASQ
jgi:dihydroorotate dehydrogenase